MSFVGTLAKVAIGVALAKGVGSMIAKSNAGGGAGTVDTSGSPNSPRQTTEAAQGSGYGGGLGDLLEKLAGAGASAGRSGAPKGGGLDELIGQLSKGGLGDLLGGLAGTLGEAAAGGTLAGGKVQRAGTQKGFGEMLNEAFQKVGEPEAKPTPDQEAMAALMLRAMIQAAKADGEIDAGEKKKLLDKLHDANEAEMAFVKKELAAPISIEGLVQQVPRGLEAQIYAMSVLAIALDNKNEAQYLHQLAEGLGISPAQVNQMHSQLGVTALYS